MIILAIDPGPKESGYLIFDSAFYHLENKIGPKIIEFGKIPNDHIFTLIFNKKTLKFNFLVIEGIVNYGTPVGKDTVNTIFWYGRFYQFALEHNILPKENIYIVSRQEIKMQHCKKTAGITDSNINFMLREKYGQPGTQKAKGPTYGIYNDVWSALAIATYFYEVMSEKKKVLNLSNFDDDNI
jgi:hypothetical protein